MKQNKQDASGSYLGYLYQFLLAQLLTFEKAKDDIDGWISLENYDDISFQDTNDDPVSLVQSKYSSSARSLSDASVDLWKTLSIWISRDKDFAKDSISPLFYLVTNSKASIGSAMSFLRNNLDRNPQEGMKILKDKAQNLEAVETKKFRDIFLGLSDEKARNLLNRIYVIDSEVDIQDIGDKIIRKNLQAVRAEHHVAVYERLLGWWCYKVIDSLTTQKPIPVRELSFKLQEIAYQFHLGNLPIDFSSLVPDDFLTWDERVFVKQVKMVTDQNIRIRTAIMDYYRASEQRSRWIREDLLNDGEVEKYERKLQEEWDLFKAGVIDEMPSQDSVDKKKVGQKILKWVEQEANIKFREYVTEPYIMRGSFHILSDDMKVGWHPDFIEMLKKVIDE